MGPLSPDPAGLLDLPAGFSYRVVSRTGESMDDGLLVPGAPDGMATFPGPDGLTIVVRNHEVDPNQQSSFGANAELLDRVHHELMYDLGEAGKPCTSGGSAQLGRIWKYSPSRCEGRPGEANSPGKLELFIEPNNSNLVANADNLTAAPWGDLVVCEDRDGDEVRLVGITPIGELYTLAHNHAHTEFAGVTFSPDGSTLFVNL